MKLIGSNVLLLLSLLSACSCAEDPCVQHVDFMDIEEQRVARIKVKNDYSGRSEIVVHSALPNRSDVTKDPVLVVEDFIKGSPELVYTLSYPDESQAYPRIKEIIFNGVVICKTNPSHDDGIIHKTEKNLTLSEVKFENNNRVSRQVSNFISKDENQCGIAVEGADGFPWLGALFSYAVEAKNYEYVCTVTLISNQHAITAASCVQNQNTLDFNLDDMILIFGKAKLDNWVQNSVITYVDKVAVHPEFSQNKGGPDLAILTLSTRLYFSKKVHPICVENQRLDGDSGTVSGWDKSRQNQVRSSTAFQLNVGRVDREECVKIHPTLPENNFCTGEIEDKRPCGRNAGVGYAVEKDQIYHLHGIATVLSTQRPHACENYTIFTDVTKEFKWINSVIN